MSIGCGRNSRYHRSIIFTNNRPTHHLHEQRQRRSVVLFLLARSRIPQTAGLDEYKTYRRNTTTKQVQHELAQQSGIRLLRLLCLLTFCRATPTPCNDGRGPQRTNGPSVVNLSGPWPSLNRNCDRFTVYNRKNRYDSGRQKTRNIATKSTTFCSTFTFTV